MFTATDLPRIAVPLLGIVALATACVASAAAPARAAAAPAARSAPVVTGLVGAVRY